VVPCHFCQQIKVEFFWFCFFVKQAFNPDLGIMGKACRSPRWEQEKGRFRLPQLFLFIDLWSHCCDSCTDTLQSQLQCFQSFKVGTAFTSIVCPGPWLLVLGFLWGSYALRGRWCWMLSEHHLWCTPWLEFDDPKCYNSSMVSPTNELESILLPCSWPGNCGPWIFSLNFCSSYIQFKFRKYVSGKGKLAKNNPLRIWDYVDTHHFSCIVPASMCSFLSFFFSQTPIELIQCIGNINDSQCNMRYDISDQDYFPINNDNYTNYSRHHTCAKPLSLFYRWSNWDTKG
jgi:hypothetical protein